GFGQTVVPTVLVEPAAAAVPPLVVVSTACRVPPTVNAPAKVESRARTASGAGSPLNAAAGRNRTLVAADRDRAVGPSATAPIANQFTPSVEYCHVPWAAVAGLVTTATPAMASPGSGSPDSPANTDASLRPGGLAVP